jgi:hypothetical protein
VLTGKSYPELHVVAANVVTGVSLQGHGLQLPEGYGFRSPFVQDVLTDAIIDHQGALTILPEREVDGEPAARIFRTFDGSVWEPLGEERVLAPSTAYARKLDEVGGTYLFSSDRPSESGTGWRPFMQVIRPADGFLRDLPGQIFGYQVSEDGRCIARFDEDDRLELLDLTTGVTHYGPVVAHADAANAAIVFVPMRRGGD